MLANTRAPRRLVPCLFMLLLAACGGSGGSSHPTATAMAWQDAEVLGNKVSLPGGEPKVRQNERGDVLVVWRNGNQLNLRLYESGLGWQPEQELDNNSEDVDAALDDQGNATVIWNGGSGGSAYVRYRDYRKGSGWQIAGTLADNQMAGGSPRVVMNARGDRLMAWTQDDDSLCPCSRLWVEIRQNGSSRREALSAASNHSTAPVIALGSSGHAAVLWRHVEHLTSPDADPYALLSAYRQPGGNWDPAVKLQNADRCRQPCHGCRRPAAGTLEPQ